MPARMEKVREALENPVLSMGGRHPRMAAALDEVEEWEKALKDLVEQVEMDESVGICLSDRVAALNALQVLSS